MILSDFIGMLLGATDLEGSRLFIRSLTSIKVTRVRKNELQILLDKYSRGDFSVLPVIVFVILSATLTKNH